MAINIREENDIVILDVMNDINNETVNEFKTILQSILNEKRKKIIINFEHVNYLCSSGLAIIGKAIKDVQDMQGKLKLVNLQRRVQRLFSMTKLTEMIEIYEGIEAAKNEF